jgi:hypothetical protein
VHCIESQSRRRAAIRSKTTILAIEAPSRGDLRPCGSHCWRRRSRAHCSAPRHRPRARPRLRSPRVRSLRHHPWCNSDSMGNRRHPSAPLCLRACREKNHKACKNDLADHSSHLKVRPAGPFTINLSSKTQLAAIRKMRQAQRRFQCNSIAGAEFPRSKRSLPSPSSASSLLSLPLSPFPIPYSLALCYNRPAVERAAKWELAQVQAESAQAAAESVAPLQGSASLVAGTEDPSRYCPVCSQRLELRCCKLLCSACGYYMSCADYY